MQCSDCGLVYLDPWPDLSLREKSLAYGEHQGEKRVRTNTRYRPSLRRTYAGILDVVFEPAYFDARPVRWFDIGCGYGEFLETLAGRVGRDSVLRGTEPNLTKQRSARARGLDVQFYDVEEMSDTFSHISMLNVFSHLPDPVSFLRLAAERLTKDGEILLQTGNGGDVQRADFPGGLSFPDHLIFGGRHSLEVALRAAGLEVFAITAFATPRFSLINFAKDTVKRLTQSNHNPARWGGPYRDLWVRARRA